MKAICKEGICPLCGEKVQYTYKGHMQEDGVYRWKCSRCGAHGQEGNKTVFDGKHYHVFDKDGNPCTIVQELSKMELENLLPLLTEAEQAEVTVFVRNLLTKKGLPL